MSTSGSVDFSVTLNPLIDEAYSICGIGSEGEAISADMYFRAKRSLNMLVKHWGASERLWLRTEASVTLVADQAGYALATLFEQKPMRVLSVRRRLTSGTIDTPLREMSRQEYFDQSSKATASVPTSFYFDPQRDTGTLYLWPPASAATAAAQSIELTYLRRIEDFDESNDDPDLPQEWLLALTYGLAEQLALKYGVNASLRQEIAGRAAMYKAQIESWDTEPASLFMQPDYQ
jgi:hypothetical protein